MLAEMNVQKSSLPIIKSLLNMMVLGAGPSQPDVINEHCGWFLIIFFKYMEYYF